MPPKGLCIKGLVPRLVFWGGDVVFKWWDQVGGLDYLGEGVLKWVSKTLALCSVVFLAFGHEVHSVLSPPLLLGHKPTFL